MADRWQGLDGGHIFASSIYIVGRGYRAASASRAAAYATAPPKQNAECPETSLTTPRNTHDIDHCTMYPNDLSGDRTFRAFVNWSQSGQRIVQI